MERETIDHAKRVLSIEADAIRILLDRLDERFISAIDILFHCKGKVVLTGIGKSGLICQKIAATLTSTGTPAIFLHPAEGAHGDLGMLQRYDVVIAVSASGETEEIIRILPAMKRMGIKLIAITGKVGSMLARHGDVVLDVSVPEEACPLGLAPTASTTATLALGDALAVTLLERRGFREEDFALIHPGGSLGKRLLLRVSDLMHMGSEIPMVEMGTPVKEAILEMTSKGFGVTGVSDSEGNRLGVVTDGDLRRAIEKVDDLLTCRVEILMTRAPKTILESELAAKALQVMEQHSITSLFVHRKGKKRKTVGIIHMHDLLKAGVV